MLRKAKRRKTAELAYIVGVALGDGNLSNPNGRAVRLRVSCDAKYPNLINRIQQVIQKSFPNNKVSKVLKPRNCVDVSCYSNEWEQILGWQAKKGPKHKQNADIPKWVFSKKKYLVNCIKGLIETDGSVYTDRGYKMVMFVSVISGLANSVYNGIKILGFEPHLYKLENQRNQDGFPKQTLYHVRVSKNTENFLNLIQPNKN